MIGRAGTYYNVIVGSIVFLFLVINFIRCEKKHSHPLIPLDYFKNINFVNANYIQICFQICHFGAIFLVGIYLQVGIGFSAILAGLIMGMQAIGAMITSRYSVKLFKVYGPKLPIIIGFTGIAILSPAIMLIRSPNMWYFGVVLFLMRGFFSGLCGTPIQTLSIIDFAKEKMGQVNSVFNASRQIAITLGVAISSLLIAMGLKINSYTVLTYLPYHETIKIFGSAFLVLPLFAIIGIFITNKIKQPA